MAKVTQIGAGMIGRAMAYDLSNDHQVSVGDFNAAALESISALAPSIATHQFDVQNENDIRGFIDDADLVLLAVPGFLGYNALKTIINHGKNVVDISFSNENFLDLNELAIKKGVTAIVDAGLAPGIPNFLLGLHDAQGEIDSFEYYVGGLPKNPKPPFNYKAPFSPIDVIEEYTRPARMVVDGKQITRPALSEIEDMYFEKLGTLEAFNTDGLRSILITMSHIRNMKEKTLRYAGHAALMANYRNAGKFDEERIEQTSNELFDAWRLEEREPEVTIMKIIIQEKSVRIEYNLHDEYDSKTGFTSMSRTTGFTATATVNMIAQGLFGDVGVFPPELVGKELRCTDYLLDYLSQRDIKLHKYVSKL